MEREIDPADVFNDGGLEAVGLSQGMVASGISFVHRILDGLDQTLISNGESRLAEMVELANLSAIIGNLFRTGIAKSSNGRFAANGPHKYPDLISTEDGVGDLEIKVALETNKPKGHLVKPGPHLTVRYVLGSEDGSYVPGKENRGDVAWIWEVRAGVLEDRHFNVSNTEGDSGKTAVINAEGFTQLQLVYCSMPLFPAGKRTRENYLASMKEHGNVPSPQQADLLERARG